VLCLATGRAISSSVPTKTAIGTLVERSTRFTMPLHPPPIPGHGAPRAKHGPPLAGRGAEAVHDAIIAQITQPPGDPTRGSLILVGDAGPNVRRDLSGLRASNRDLSGREHGRLTALANRRHRRARPRAILGAAGSPLGVGDVAACSLTCGEPSGHTVGGRVGGCRPHPAGVLVVQGSRAVWSTRRST
jgi:hypothetical protein